MFASNAIIAKGLQNPRCQAAMQLMQQDPKAAQQRFQGDPEVRVFARLHRAVYTWTDAVRD